MARISILLTFLAMTLAIHSQAQIGEKWEVFVEGKKVAHFSDSDTARVVNLEASELDSDGKIGVRYYTGHPCLECHYVLLVKGNQGAQLTEAETHENQGEMAVGIAQLFGFWAQQTDGYFKMYSYQRTASGQKTAEKYLFDLRFH